MSSGYRGITAPTATCLLSSHCTLCRINIQKHPSTFPHLRHTWSQVNITSQTKLSFARYGLIKLLKLTLFICIRIQNLPYGCAEANWTPAEHNNNMQRAFIGIPQEKQRANNWDFPVAGETEEGMWATGAESAELLIFPVKFPPCRTGSCC